MIKDAACHLSELEMKLRAGKARTHRKKDGIDRTGGRTGPDSKRRGFRHLAAAVPVGIQQDNSVCSGPAHWETR